MPRQGQPSPWRVCHLRQRGSPAALRPAFRPQCRPRACRDGAAARPMGADVQNPRNDGRARTVRGVSPSRDMGRQDGRGVQRHWAQRAAQAPLQRALVRQFLVGDVQPHRKGGLSRSYREGYPPILRKGRPYLLSDSVQLRRVHRDSQKGRARHVRSGESAPCARRCDARQGKRLSLPGGPFRADACHAAHDRAFRVFGIHPERPCRTFGHIQPHRRPPPF